MVLTFEVPTDLVYMVTAFTHYIKFQYTAQSVFYTRLLILEVRVDPIYRNNVVNLALAYGFTILQG